MAIHATRRAAVEQGDTAIVFGAGTVGLLTAAMARVSGATTVVIVDVDHGRVEYALSNGFAHKGFVVPSRRNAGENSGQFDSAKELAEDVTQIASLNDIDFEGADVTFDCTGKEICMQAGLFVSDPRIYRLLTANNGQGNKTWGQAYHGRHGHSRTNSSDICVAPERSRYHWHFPVCEYIRHRDQDYLFRCPA